MGNINNLIQRAYAEEGYIEKASNMCLDSKLANKGSNNYTKYSRDIDNVGLMGCQAQAWCATHQFWLEVQEYGVDKALEHWNMTRKSYVGYNCFSTYTKFENVGKVGHTPKLGALVVFTFSHMGRVISIDNTHKTFQCEEGNTSSNLADRNGGQVKIKTRSFYDSTIKGFCYIDYDSDEPPMPQTVGWVQESNGRWRYYQKSGDIITYIRNDWHKDVNGQWSYFDDDGYALCNQWLFGYKGYNYYFNGSCYMVASKWVQLGEAWYYLTADGTMATDAYILSQQPPTQIYYYVNPMGVYDSRYDKTTLDPNDRLVV
jgi:glucan-binding YG repeat protein